MQKPFSNASIPPVFEARSRQASGDKQDPEVRWACRLRVPECSSHSRHSRNEQNRNRNDLGLVMKCHETDLTSGWFPDTFAICDSGPWLKKKRITGWPAVASRQVAEASQNLLDKSKVAAQLSTMNITIYTNEQPPIAMNECQWAFYNVNRH